MKSCRPISNLPFISKIIENVEGIVEGSMTELIMLDLFATFDVIDHSIIESFRNFLSDQGKGLKLDEVVPHRYNSVCCSRG